MVSGGAISLWGQLWQIRLGLPWPVKPGRQFRRGVLVGREEVMRHVTWFLGAVENVRFFDLQVHAFADPDAAVAEVKAEAFIKPTKRIYRQEYVVFLRAAGGKIAFLREYFDPTRAAKAMNKPILGLDS
jgi:uncharacterized protein